MWYMDNQQEIKVFSTEEKALGFIRNALMTHKFMDGVSPILRHNKKPMTVDGVMEMMESQGFYINDCFGENHIHPFTIKLLTQEVA